MMRYRIRSATQRGFTFLELMITLALISMLMAFLFPLLAQGKLAARRSGCQSNLAQLGAALHLYAQDHDGRFPATNDDWTVATTIYTKNTSVVKCASEPANLVERYQPGTTRKVGNSSQIYSSFSYRAGFANDDPAEEPVGRDWGAWHENGVNVLYLGGNVRWKPAAEAPVLHKAPRPVPSGEIVYDSSNPYSGQ